MLSYNLMEVMKHEVHALHKFLQALIIKVCSFSTPTKNSGRYTWKIGIYYTLCRISYVPVIWN